jgi:mannose-6-phosphate isomerase-like protein (cupin superfamily)
MLPNSVSHFLETPKMHNRTPSDTTWKALPRRSIDGKAGTYASFLTSVKDGQDFKLATWRGEPGVFDSPKGAPFAETYCIYRGEGSLEIGDEKITLRPGVIVNLPKGVPFKLSLHTQVEKFAVIHEIDA